MNEVRTLPLTQGKVALVDAADYEWLNQWKWMTRKSENTFYAIRRVRHPRGSQSHIRLHRVILNAPAGVEIDHRNHNGLDNRRCNIRLCSHGENGQNSKKQDGPTTSVYKGVYWQKAAHKWHAQIGYDRKLIYLGLFAYEADAALAYNAAASRLHGEFARLNIIQDARCSRVQES